jgi:hypothetical protein
VQAIVIGAWIEWRASQVAERIQAPPQEPTDRAEEPLGVA